MINIGDTIYNWTILEEVKNEEKRRLEYKCICNICGEIQYVDKYKLRRGDKVRCKSCIQIFEDTIIGRKFGKLEVVSFSHKNKSYHTYYNCKCECGKMTTTRKDGLLRGEVTSCGCLNMSIYGLSYHRLYKIYTEMKYRCYNINSEHYPNYGGRGIKIYQPWLDDFILFYNWAQLNGYDDSLTLDRIDVNGDYIPKNCRWITMYEQADNKRHTVYIRHNNSNMTIRQIANMYNVDYNYLYRRIRKNNMTVEDAVKQIKELNNNEGSI